MSDLILTSRLESLDQNLTQILEETAWLKELVLTRYVLRQSEVCKDFWPGQLWDELDSTVRKAARKLKADLEDIQTLLPDPPNKKPEEAAQDIRQAWERYKGIHKKSQEVFGECLEYISGLALRDRGFDREICGMADNLIVSCANDWNLNWRSLTVLASQEKLGQTLASIIRLRFPEWSIWTLPFTAREFAHVALHDQKNPELLEFVNKKVDELFENEPRLVEARNAGVSGDNLRLLEKQARKYAQNHIHDLITDAFATYTMGPAYACAAFLLRFNPVDGGSDSSDHPTDAKRAEVVLGMLKEMNKKATGGPYFDIINRLEKEWTTARTRSTPSLGYPTARSTPRLEEMINVDAFISETLKVFSISARATAPFPAKDQGNGWLTAQAWQSKLMEKNIPNSSSFEITNTSRLRDALNAAWLCRIYVEPKNNIGIKNISERVLILCREIIKPAHLRQAGGGSSVGSASSPPPQNSFNK